MRAYVFPGQGAQFLGMGQELYSSSKEVQKRYEIAQEILGFDISKIMFEGTAEELKETKVTQPAIFLHSINNFLNSNQDTSNCVVAGHSLGEFTALVANQTLSFEDALNLVKERAFAMQEACEKVEGTMAAVLGLENNQVEQICADIDEVVVPANYNCPGQLVISGSKSGIELAMKACEEAGARRVLPLVVGGAFHSPLMQPAQERLANAIHDTSFNKPIAPIYQNVSALAVQDPELIKENLIAQLTSPVKWTQTMENLIADGMTSYVESGAKVLCGFIKRIDRKFPVENV